MPEFLREAFTNNSPISTSEIAFRLLIALAFGFAVSGIYRATRFKAEVLESFPTTLVLLSVLIAAVTEVIGDSVARAFSLVGALSIVRFRTVVRDTQDTAFVIFAVVVGMATGAGALRVAIITTAVVGVAALLTMSRKPAQSPVPSAPPEFLLAVTMALGTDLSTLTSVCDRYVQNLHLRLFATAKQGAALRAVYGVNMLRNSSPAELVASLNRLEGVQSVEVQRPDVVED